jgi:hypothetical protein
VPLFAEPDVYEYSELWYGDPDANGNLPVYGSGTLIDNNCNGTWVQADNYLRDPNTSPIDQGSASDWCQATSYTDALLSYDDEGVPEGDYESQVQGYVNDQFWGCASKLTLFKKFQAVYKYDHFNAFTGQYVYLRDISHCTGKCQGLEFCYPEHHNWLRIPGWKVKFVWDICIANPPWPRPSNVRPGCKQEFGSPLWTQTDCE